MTNGGVLDVNVDQFDTEAFRTDKLELTSGNIADHNGNVISGVFDINSSDYVLNADLVNDRTWDTSKSNYGYGIVAMNSDGHLTINGNGDVDNGTELDNSSVDNVVAAMVTTKFVSTTQLALALSLITKIKKLST